MTSNPTKNKKQKAKRKEKLAPLIQRRSDERSDHATIMVDSLIPVWQQLLAEEWEVSEPFLWGGEVE
jgi:hypothetical protein